MSIVSVLPCTCSQELAPEVAARIAEAERIAAEAEAEAAAFAEQAAAVQAEHDLMRQEQLQASLPPHPCCTHVYTLNGWEKILYQGLTPETVRGLAPQAGVGYRIRVWDLLECCHPWGSPGEALYYELDRGGTED